MYAFNYNRQKFANLEKCDEKQKRRQLIPSSPLKAIKRPLPVPPPVPPTPPPKPDDPVDDKKLEVDTASASTAAAAVTKPSVNGERKQKKRRTRSFERLRDQSNDIELSDSDEDIAVIQKIPQTKAVDEPDASAISPCLSEPFNVISNTTSDEAAICVDSLAAGMEASTFSDRSQLSYDDILKIEETFEDDGANGILRNIVVDIHTEPTIELRIHESDSDPANLASKSAQGSFNVAKLTKEHLNADIEQERCYSEDDAIDPDDDSKEKAERLVQSDSEVLSKTPLELVVECDINENVIVSEEKPTGEIIDLDHNHNDIVKSTEIDKNVDQANIEPTKSTDNGSEGMNLVQNRERPPIVQPNETRRGSISSRSSCSESDGNEPDYATVDTALNMVSFLFGPFLVESKEMEKFERAQKNLSNFLQIKNTFLSLIFGFEFNHKQTRQNDFIYKIHSIKMRNRTTSGCFKYILLQVQSMKKEIQKLQANKNSTIAFSAYENTKTYTSQ